MGYDLKPVVSQVGLRFVPDLTLRQALDVADVEGLVMPGGPIRAQGTDLTALIQKLDQERFYRGVMGRE